MLFQSPMFFKVRAAAIFLAVILLSGCGLSLAGDVTPPPNYIAPTDAPVETPTNEMPANLQAVFPIVPPDPAMGASIYAEKCEPCHGIKGMGDGSQAGNLPNPASPIGSPELARKSRPVDWWQMVSEGNLQKFMPGFQESLNDRQRWDVVAYALSLSTSAVDLEAGKLVYAENCAACHGENGEGDGVQAASLEKKPAAWKQDQARLARLSVDEIAALIMSGTLDHPGFADRLEGDQPYQVAAYIRTLGYARTGQPAESASSGGQSGEGADGSGSGPGAPQATGEAVSLSNQSVVITGQVTNGTSESKVPVGLKVNLLGFEGMQSAFDLTASVDENGAYRFEDVPYGPDYVYIAQIDANGLVYNSDILQAGDISNAQANLPLQIFETEKDPSALRVDRMHIFFDFTQPGLVQVVNLYVISNPTDRVVMAESKDKPIVEFSVPKEASNLQFQDGQIGDGRYVQTENGFGDTQAIIPGIGQHQVLFAYDMAYDRKLDISLQAPLPVDAAIVMVPPAGVKLSSDDLTSAGQRDVQGMSFQMYQSTGSIAKGDTLNVSLAGKARTETGAAAVDGSNQPLFIGVGIFGLVMIGAGLWLHSQRKGLQPAQVDAGESTEALIEEIGGSSESILDAILALDDLHASGKLPEGAYQERRAALKASLAKALEREKGS